jgi:hypothetical protein
MARVARTSYRNTEGDAVTAFACGWRIDVDAVWAPIFMKSRPK